ncbi:hypothetical protein [Edaphobacter modestus]|uniref:hypothetical protein n=1 Tax=Edaphobacter modestus TaxID=388466 RepID=UPI0013EE54CD|nr:hypothetical protein [Edaphobacter modestus]
MSRFDAFIPVRKFLRNVSPATVSWYTSTLKWLPSESPTQADLKGLCCVNGGVVVWSGSPRSLVHVQAPSFPCGYHPGVRSLVYGKHCTDAYLPDRTINMVSLSAAERTQASVLLSQGAVARSSAGLVLRLESSYARTDERTVFTGIELQAEVQRQRFTEASKVVSMKKPPQREHQATWRSQSAWAGRR